MNLNDAADVLFAKIPPAIDALGQLESILAVLEWPETYGHDLDARQDAGEFHAIHAILEHDLPALLASLQAFGEALPPRLASPERTALN